MAMQISYWSEEQCGDEVKRRFDYADQNRRPLEDQWQRNERAVYGTNGLTGYSFSVDELLDNGPIDTEDGEQSVELNVAYTFKNLRFIHSQLSANPPSVAMKPTSPDQEDRKRADAADRVGRYALRHYKLQERFDNLTLNTLVYGLGIMKVRYDSTKGDIIDFNLETNEMVLEGDIDISIPHTWNVFIDPDARSVDQIKWVIERLYVDYDEACAKWPDKRDILNQARLQNGDSGDLGFRNNKSTIRERHYNCVELLEYWETGLPSNGYTGRYCITTSSGQVVVPCKPSPNRFARAGSVSAIMRKNLPDVSVEQLIHKLPQMATLPYHILTDIDVPNSVWGKSFIEYAAPLQSVLREIDSTTLNNLRANAVARMIIPEGAEISNDLSNSPWDITVIKNSSQSPYFMEVPQLMPEMVTTRQNVEKGINDVSGTNESMFGQQSREQSGASMQYATNQGNMIRRRLFNKYVLVVESVYKSILNLIRKHWTVERNIMVVGKEKALEAISLKGADIDGGYDVVGEYGTNLSLDPITRREEILALQPLFQGAGIPPKMSLKLMKLNDLEGSYDAPQLAEDRQREIFERIIMDQIQIQPEQYQDHAGMLEWALYYRMTSDFEYLDESSKALILEHITLRTEMAAAETAGAAQATTAMPATPAPPTGALG